MPRCKLRIYLAAVSITMVICMYLLFHPKMAEKIKQQEFEMEEVDKLIKLASIENAKRISHVKRACRKYNLGLYKEISKPSVFKEPPSIQYEVFFYDVSHKLSYCPIFKAGSSTWLYHLATLNGYSEDEILNSKVQLSELVRKVLPQLETEEAKEVLRDSFKFVVVRHPFERLLSAYRDKLENAAIRGTDGTYHFYKKYGSKIVAKYRNNASIDMKNILLPGQYVWNDDKKPFGFEPTFKEFVRYILDVDLINRADDHWIPYHLFCTPCHLHYDVISKVETMFQDQLYIIKEAKLHPRIVPKWRHKTNPFANSKSLLANDLAKIYFSQITADELTQLYEKYKLDFELFHYNHTEYYEYVQNNILLR